MTKYINEQVEKIEKPIALWVCLVVLGILGLAYLYFINGFISNTLDMRQSVVEAQSLASKIADSEFKYTQLSQDINESFYMSNGFIVIGEKDTEYVTVRGGPVVTFSGSI